MQISPTPGSAVATEADAVVVGIYESAEGAAAGFDAAAKSIDAASGGALTKTFQAGGIKADVGEVAPLWALPGVAAPLVLVVGLGDKSEMNAGAAGQACGAAARWLAGTERSCVAFFVGEDWSAEQTEKAVSAVLAGCVGADLYRREKNRHPFKTLLWAGDDEGRQRGAILGEAVNFTRCLVNEPPNKIYPISFVERAEKMAAGCGLSVEVWDEKRLEKERCGCILGVSRGSSQPPRLLILEHKGGGPDAPTLALVGKGVTFDSGGLSLKPSESMKTMKCDMAGAATVVGAMQAIAQLKLPVNVIGLAGLAENMLGADAYKLGDVLTARNGVTVEIHNTDAEGRLVLADTLATAIDRGADKIIDLATLTGACVVALGLDVAGLMTNNEAWCDDIASAAKRCGEACWPLPMFPEFGKQIRGEVADIKNVGEGRWGGAMTAAKFLEEFVDDTPWVHIDIAGPSFLEKPKPWLDGGGSGAFVHTLVEVARAWGA